MSTGHVSAANVGLAVRVVNKNGIYAARDNDAASDGKLPGAIVPFAYSVGVS